MINIYRQKISDDSASTTTTVSSSTSVSTTTIVATSTSQTTTTSNTKSTISEFLYYKNNVWAHQIFKPPHNSPLTELLYYKNSYWSKTDFFKPSISKNISISPKNISTSDNSRTPEKKETEIVKGGFNTLNFFEGIICIITLYLIGFIGYKLYKAKKSKKTIQIQSIHKFPSK